MKKGEFLATQQAIYNQTAYRSRDVYQSQSPIYALVNQFDAEEFWSRIQFASYGRVAAVRFAHPEALGSLKTYPAVLLFNNTYKTNKYGMRLLNIIYMDACSG